VAWGGNFNALAALTAVNTARNVAPHAALAPTSRNRSMRDNDPLETPTASAAGAHLLPYTEISLADGRRALIRPMNPSDADAERAFIAALSPEARRNRFQEQFAVPSETLVNQLVDVDHVNDEAFVALSEESQHTEIVGVSRYAVGSNPQQCEIAVTVLDAWQDLGLGTVLMRRLIDAARDRGITRMVSLDFAENQRMTHLAHALGFVTTPDPDDRTQVVHTLTL
jgi:GNAT superfamily N-acetyltransferase